MKKYLFGLTFALVLVSVVSLGSIAQAKTKILPKKVSVLSTAVSSATWTTVLDGKVADANGTLSLSTSMSWAQAHAYLWDGQDFKVAIQSGLGGGSGSQSFNCAYVYLEDGDNVFHCYPANTTNDYKPTLNLRFDTDGTVSYISPTPGQADGVLEVKIFVKK